MKPTPQWGWMGDILYIDPDRWKEERATWLRIGTTNNEYFVNLVAFFVSPYYGSVGKCNVPPHLQNIISYF